jgi:RimJ/RimL family protein N-acetyltransferase
VIEGRLVRLRPIRRADLPRLRSWHDAPGVARYWGQATPLVREDQFEEDLSGRFARFDECGYLAIVPLEPEDAPLIGRVEWEALDRHNRSAEVMILIGDPAYWGHGFGTDTLVALLRYLFHAQGLHRVSLSVLSWNERAIRSYEKVGFVAEGVLRDDVYDDGRYHDQTVMGILRHEFDARWHPESSVPEPGTSTTRNDQSQAR